MVKIILIKLIFILSIQFTYTFESSIIKIESYPCQFKSLVYEGSGIIASLDNEVFIITSEHIILPDNELQVCIKGYNEKIGEVELQLERTSFKDGLSKLKIISNKTLESIELKKISISDKKINAAGYPAGSNRLQRLESGEILNINGDRSLIPNLNHMIEVKNLPVEFGMSGGILFSDTEFIGLLSHQYLKREAGKKSELNLLNNEGKIHNNDLALVIPRSHIISWLEQKDEDEIQWNRITSNGLNKELLGYGPLEFEKVFIDSKYLALGGDDGSGIGGDSKESDTKEKILAIKVSLSSSDEIKRTIDKINSPTIKRWYQWLLEGQELYIVQVLNEENQSIETISSFDQLVTLWLREKYTPMVIRGNLASLDSKIENIISKSNKLRSLINEIEDSNELSLWKNSFFTSLDLLNSNLSYTLSDFEQKNSKYQWNVLYNYDFDLALEIELTLEQLKELFE